MDKKVSAINYKNYSDTCERIDCCDCPIYYLPNACELIDDNYNVESWILQEQARQDLLISWGEQKKFYIMNDPGVVKMFRENSFIKDLVSSNFYQDEEGTVTIFNEFILIKPNINFNFEKLRKFYYDYAGIEG